MIGNLLSALLGFNQFHQNNYAEAMQNYEKQKAQQEVYNSLYSSNFNAGMYGVGPKPKPDKGDVIDGEFTVIQDVLKITNEAKP